MTAVELDPDPTPTCTPWQEYLTAAQGLDAVRRAIASESAAATRTVSSARAELARARARLDAQRQQLISESVAAGAPTPPLDPSPPEQAWARSTAAGSAAGALAALGQAHTLIDAADAYLLGAEPPDGAPPPPQWPTPPWVIVAAVGGFVLVLLCGLAVVVGLMVA